MQLRRIDDDGAYVSLVAGRAAGPAADLDEPGPRPAAALASDKETSRATSLVSGVTRWSRQLDYVISKLSSKDPKKLDTDVKAVRSCCYLSHAVDGGACAAAAS